MKWINHLKTINHHKFLVMRYCFRAGLYGQGLLHDLSKYAPTEFLVGAKYYQGTRSPNNAEREDKGYSAAWLHHKGRNRHHVEYWVDYAIGKRGLHGVEMPLRYVLEMMCDRIAACRIYQKEAYTDASPYEYYIQSKERDLVHPETERLLMELLVLLRDEGEERLFEKMRQLRKGARV